MAKPRTLATRIALAWARRRARRRPPAPFVALAAETRARILVVNTTGIGDTIFCTAPLADLRESFPNARLAAFLDRRRVSLLAGNRRIDEVLLYPGKFRRVRATIAAIRRGAFDLALIQHANDPDVVPLIAAAGVPAIVGYDNHTFSVLYALKVAPFSRSAGHTMDSRLNLCRAIGAAGRHWHTEITPPPPKLEAAQALLRELGIGPGAALALNIGGSAPRKRWPVEKWSELAKLLARRGMPVVILGGPEDRAAGEEIRQRVGSQQGVHVVVGRLGLMGDVALLSLCRAHVAGDTGLLHAGFALDVPSVALFGPNDPAWTGPYPKQANARVLQPPRDNWPPKYHRAADHDGQLMRLIGVEEVEAALGSWL